ncbi:MAG: putative toxin-antitoxin system toxin component, PIN family [Candidatus Dormibacteria bacterium]
MRIVVDTNVVVSAVLFPGGFPERVFRMVIEGRAELVTSRPLLAELGRVLGDKFGWQVDKVEMLVSQLARLGRLVDPTEAVADITTDPADNRVLEAAVAGDAATIVSGDHHLLDLGTWRGIAILAPADFVRRASGGVGPGATPSGGR